MAKIRILVDKSGNPKILDVEGAGTNCVEATKNFEKQLGSVAEEQRQLTDSYYAGDTLDNTQQQEGG